MSIHFVSSFFPLSLLKADILSAMDPVAMAPWSVHQPLSVFTWAGPRWDLGEGGAIFCQLGTTGLEFSQFGLYLLSALLYFSLVIKTSLEIFR